MPAYASSFKYKRPKASTSAIDIDSLASRFHKRAVRIRKKGSGYVLGLQAGLVSALVLLLLAFTTPLSFNGEFEVVQVEQELVTMEEIQQTRQQVKPPPPPRPMIPLAVPDDEILLDEDLDLDAALELDMALVDLQPPPVAEEEEAHGEEVFVVVESMPKMKGGMASLLQAVKYPTIARKQGVEGNVIVKIVVDEEGNPSAPIIMRSPSPLLEDAAVKAVMKQQFEPGRQRGRAVKVEVVIPVKFRLTT